MLKHILLLLASGLTFMTIELSAMTNSNLQDPPQMEAIDICSNSAELNDKKGTIVYTGNVVMNQGNHHLTSDILTIQRDTHGKIESMIAEGKPAELIQNQDKIRGEKLVYFPDTHVLSSVKTLGKRTTVILTPRKKS